MNVGRICKKNVATIRKGQSIVEAARRMRKHHVGDLVVVEGDRDVPVGILTDRDIVVGVLARDPEHLMSLEVGDVLTEEVLTAREDEDVTDLLQRMKQSGIRRAPVVNYAGALTGIFTLDDILGLLSSDLASVAALVARQRARERERRS
jgi:CBS domain-containing protein